MEALPFFLFSLAWRVGIAAWFFVVIEAIAAFLFQSWAFRLGFKALVIEEDAPCPKALATAAKGETERLKYRVLEGNRCMFRRKNKLFELRWNTPLEIKGEIAWSAGKLVTTGRYPFGVMLFGLSWLAGWSTVGILDIAKGQITGIFLAAVGWIVVLGMFLHSRWIELRRFQDYAAEMKDALAENNDI